MASSSKEALDSAILNRIRERFNDRTKLSMATAVRLAQGLLPEIAAKGCDELWLNPGAESPEVLAEAERLGLNVIQACSILGVGLCPSSL